MAGKKKNASTENTGAEEQTTGGRRRGDVLENAILQAAWDEWNEVGYIRLTMENIALRAKTNKNAIYRRWQSKAEIVAAAIGKHLVKPEVIGAMPDTGDLRSDMLALLHGIVKPMQTIGAETIHGLMTEFYGGNLIASLPEMMQDQTDNKLTAAIGAILQNAEKRGEIKLENVSPRVISLPANLLVYEVLTTHEPVADTTITGIIDDIFMPLVRLKK
ncbi:TetR/AcrR family transcriptional regulator [Paenibacillus sp. HW567]|uniref:TetR/AcrR family transcriptional regulator n=1 Tax=Paenibacillus sp. HW567 TaxID=1034769 RepID=UPI00037BF2A2|nr:TetR/AcrR family transcriptional regulator [Paenibacillus sp. HW567]